MLTIIRGVPGSGKTTLANNLMDECSDSSSHYEADSYFIRKDGVYDFNPALLKNAHEWCYRNVTEDLKLFECDVFVSNTFTRLWEMEKYISFAKEHNIPFRVIRCTGNYKNIHNVPESKVKEMLERFEDYEGEEFM